MYYFSYPAYSLSDDKVAQVLQDDSGVSPIPTPKHKKPEYKIEVLVIIQNS